MSPAPVLTRERAPGVVQAAVSERDAIQANLLELDGSFGKRVLEGAALTGQTKRRWDLAAVALGRLWQLFSAYSAVVDRAADAVTRHLGAKELAAIAALLTGPSIELASGPAPLGGRDLADPGRETLTLVAAVTRMRRAFADITEVTSGAEQVWNEMAGRLDSIASDLARVRPLAASFGDEALTGNVAAAESKLAKLRDILNTDPLALWLGGPAPGKVDTSGAERLAERVAATVTRIDELLRLRDDARQRIAQVTAAVAAARAAGEDAAAAWQRAAAKVTAASLPPSPRRSPIPPRSWPTSVRCWTAGAGPGWRPSSISSNAIWPRPPPASVMPSGPRRPWSAGAMSCAACSVPTRPRQRGSVPRKTPAWPNATIAPTGCCGRHRVTSRPRPKP